MSEWWLLGLLTLLTLAVSVLIVYPLRRHTLASLVIIPLIFVVVAIGYYNWGGFRQFQQFTQQNNRQEIAQKMLKSLKNPQELVDKLRAKLSDDPQSAKGWYLLGRLYLNQGQLEQAKEAFAKAYGFKPDEEEFAVNYAHCLWQINSQKFDTKIRNILHKLIENNPNQPDGLAMLAMDAFMSESYEKAISYWERLLTIAPPQSEEAQSIRKAIAQAQKQLQHKV